MGLVWSPGVPSAWITGEQAAAAPSSGPWVSPGPVSLMLRPGPGEADSESEDDERCDSTEEILAAYMRIHLASRARILAQEEQAAAAGGSSCLF